MQYLLALAVLVCGSSLARAQEVDALKARRDSLLSRRSIYEGMLSDLQREIDSVDLQIAELQYESGREAGLELITKQVANFYDGPGEEVLSFIPGGTRLLVLDADGRSFKVRYEDQLGWVSASSVFMTPALKRLIEEKRDDERSDLLEEIQERDEAIERERRAALRTANAKVQTRRQRYVDDNPHIREEYKQAVVNGEIMLGMTPEMVRATWGPPADVNRTVTVGLVREQWVYESAYVYFENGILTTWQD